MLKDLVKLRVRISCFDCITKLSFEIPEEAIHSLTSKVTLPNKAENIHLEVSVPSKCLKAEYASVRIIYEAPILIHGEERWENKSIRVHDFYLEELQPLLDMGLENEEKFEYNKTEYLDVYKKDKNNYLTPAPKYFTPVPEFDKAPYGLKITCNTKDINNEYEMLFSEMRDAAKAYYSILCYQAFMSEHTMSESEAERFTDIAVNLMFHCCDFSYRQAINFVLEYYS